MNSLAFFDSNILVYADDESAGEKQVRAFQLFAYHRRQQSAVISLQVMQEYFSVTTRKLRIDAEVAQRKVELLSRAIVVRFVEADVVTAIELHRLNRISFWDALIVQAARLSGATILYSEDLQHGATFGRVRVVNPFLEIANQS
jgi:predicted nucleic acid-binding protein